MSNPSNTRSLYGRGILLAVAGIALISPDGTMLHLVPTVPVWTALFMRTIGMAVTLFLLLGLYYRGTLLQNLRGLGVPGVIAAALQGCGNLLFLVSIQHTTVAETLVLIATMPFWSALIGRLVIGEKVSKRTWIAIAVALIGIIIVVGEPILQHGLTGAVIWHLTGVAAAVVQGTQLVAVRKAGDRDMTGVIMLGSLFTAACCLPFTDFSTLGGHNGLVLGTSGFIILPISLALFLSGARYAPAAEVALVALVETILGPIWVWLVLGEVPGAAALIGGSLVIAAVAGNALVGLRAAHRAALSGSPEVFEGRL